MQYRPNHGTKIKLDTDSNGDWGPVKQLQQIFSRQTNQIVETQVLKQKKSKKKAIKEQRSISKKKNAHREYPLSKTFLSPCLGSDASELA